MEKEAQGSTMSLSSFLQEHQYTMERRKNNGMLQTSALGLLFMKTVDALYTFSMILKFEEMQSSQFDQTNKVATKYGHDPNDTAEDGDFNGVKVFFFSSLKSGEAFTLPGIGIFISSEDSKDVDLLRHEFGHVIQSAVWGAVAYYNLIAPTSIESTQSNYDHMSTWTEWTANWLSYNWFYKPSDWYFTKYPIEPTDLKNPLSFPK